MLPGLSMFSAFSQPAISVRRTVKLLEPMPTWQFFWPEAGALRISLFSTSRPVLLFSITHIEFDRIRELRIVTQSSLSGWPVS